MMDDKDAKESQALDSEVSVANSISAGIAFSSNASEELSKFAGETKVSLAEDVNSPAKKSNVEPATNSASSANSEDENSKADPEIDGSKKASP